MKNNCNIFSMNKCEALQEINDTQDFYVRKLIDIIVGTDSKFENLKEIDFTSPTGTGKTIMVCKLINSMPNYFFFITSLSKGQLRHQIERKIKSFCHGNNYVVFGLNEYTKNTILKEDDIINLLPTKQRIIWIRDEGHIATNRWQEILRDRSEHIINFSATNKTNNGIQCNFSHTMMLRTVSQNSGTPEDALNQLLEVKNIHKGIQGYNPCALFRVLHDENLGRVIRECEKRNLSYINITDESYDMSEICEDDNSYDVIINKFKITEGIDLKRCHVIYMDSKPSNEATVVQVIGRARRNALFWRNDIDILSRENAELLAETRRCFVFYNIPETEVAQNDLGELTYSLCDTISVEALKPNIRIHVTNGQMDNGLYVIELEGKNGYFNISHDEELMANIVSNNSFYEKRVIECNSRLIDLSKEDFNIKRIYLKPNVLEYFEKETRRSQRDHDRQKYYFYFVKKYCLSNPEKTSFIDIDYWEQYLGMSNKIKLVDKGKWGEFFFGSHERYELFKREIEGHFAKHFSEEDIDMAKEYSKIDRAPEYVEKRDILMHRNWYFSTRIDYDFEKYIEKIEYVNTSLVFKVKDALETRHNVKQISSNKYKYSPHPFTNYLIEKGIDSLDLINKRVESCKGRTVLFCAVSYWKTMLKRINAFEEIDDYDVKLVTFSEINNILKLGFSDNAVKTYSLGAYPVKIDSKIDEPFFLKYDYKTKLFDYGKRGPLIIYRRDYDGHYVPFSKTINDYEIAVIGPDIMKYSNGRYIEDMPVTSKIEKYCKFNNFISKKYKPIIEKYSSDCFKSKNDFGFDKKCNSCLGFCVEYYAKIKLFGEEAFKPFIDAACLEANSSEINNAILVRAAMIIYREEMKRCYGSSLAGIIPSISIINLVKENYSSFVDAVTHLGNRTAKFVLEKVYGGKIDSQTTLYDPDLSVNHISALCDFISNDTILDLKCTSSITVKHIKQVLSYYYLSTKRSDLNIKKLIIYDAPTDKYIKIDI